MCSPLNSAACLLKSCAVLGQGCMKSALVPAQCLAGMQGQLKSGSSWWCSKPGGLPSTGCSAQARSAGEMQAREELSSLLHQTCNGHKRQREPGHEWCLGGARAAGKKRGKRAPVSPDKGLGSVLERTRSKAWGPPCRPTLGAKKASSRRARGMRATSVEHEQQARGHNGPREPWQGPMLNAAEDSKNPR